MNIKEYKEKLKVENIIYLQKNPARYNIVLKYVI